MTNYLPRFTLRRALIAVALLALFLGWLRLDRARVYRRQTMQGMSWAHFHALDKWGHSNIKQRVPVASVTRGIEFSPIWPNRRIYVERALQKHTGEVTYRLAVNPGFSRFLVISLGVPCWFLRVTSCRGDGWIPLHFR